MINGGNEEAEMLQSENEHYWTIDEGNDILKERLQFLTLHW